MAGAGIGVGSHCYGSTTWGSFVAEVVDVDELLAQGVPIDQLVEEDEGRGIVREP